MSEMGSLYSKEPNVHSGNGGISAVFAHLFLSCHVLVQTDAVPRVIRTFLPSRNLF